MNILSPVDWTFPIPIFLGPGRLADVGAFCQKTGITAPLIVTDRGSRDLPFIGRLQEVLAAKGLRPQLFSDVNPNPTGQNAQAGKAVYDAGNHDGVIAIGGGSAMDAAKAISLIAGRDTPLWAFDFDVTPPEAHGFAPLICVPTTAGTGAETESTGMITDTSRGIKGCVWHPDHRPALAILDPELSVGLPRTLTAWTGCDALTHAIEAYCVDMFHPMCDGAALQALQLINGSIRQAVDQPENLEARMAMLAGSCLAGVSFLKGLGMVHAISHMVGALYDTQHGLTNAVVLPTVLRFNRPEIENRIPAMSDALGLQSRDFDGFYAAVCAILDDLDIPKNLAELGVGPDRIEELARKAKADPAAATNPRQADVGEIESLISEAIEQAR
ncbi:iron-containing alcohol dehydrogenase [Antarcticimicrobium luteum]|uniref:Alcohol dehydrogenase 2 n=1 Tax=Antarcticimicrobium luteum TaxID=2547397 RepID=A0A4R5VG80_9RHOB|nr:iron-containing alcohol dehydrogenase [Antarcticimicrobium luteum]TDK51435.1 iron-containing alcohol dehydrogenase [Antarcticimicrobium luteum]